MRRSTMTLAVVVALGVTGTGLTGQEPTPKNVEAGTELVSMYFGATGCAPCVTPEMKQAVQTINTRLREQASERGLQFFSVGVALDLDIASGVELLGGTAYFDEVVIGRNWTNSAMIELVWRREDGVGVIPQCFSSRGRSRLRRPDTVLARSTC